MKTATTIEIPAWIFCFSLLISCSTPSKNATAVEESVIPEEVTRKDERKTILFFGNSITAGYQLDLEEAFPAIIQNWLDTLGYNYRVINAGLSGETTASGKNRIEWVLKTFPDVFVLELGANDGLRGLPLEESRKNLQEIIDAVKAVNPEVKILLAGMQVPPNLGQDYTKSFRTIFPELSESNETALIPFILEGVAGDPKLNLSDGIHPTPEGHQILASTVWKYLVPLLDNPS
ncbi:MAG: arylesterase [Cyclobacteriaceae bacterium]